MKLQQKISLWFPVTLYICFIFWLSSAPRVPPPFLRWEGADKFFHIGEYTPLGMLLLRAFSRSAVSPRRRVLWTAVCLAGLTVGVFDEFYQSFVPTRTCSVWDASADAIGVCVGQLLYSWKWARTP